MTGDFTASEACSRILAACQRSIKICGVEHRYVGITPTGIRPRLETHPREWYTSGPELLALDPKTRYDLGGLLVAALARLRHKWEERFDQAITSLVTSDSAGPSSSDLERSVCEMCDQRFQQAAEQMRDCLRRTVQNHCRQDGSEKRPGGFSDSAVAVLELAFSKSPSLTTRECTLVAEAAGISHQQVRTWFQNKRNRGNKGRRTASTSELNKRVTEQVIPERRVISGLPRRNQQKVITDEGLDIPQSTRPVRSLPKRKALSPVESPAESTTTSTSLDSIPSSGGFLSPLDTRTTNHPTISFPDNFSFFPQGTQSWTHNESGMMESPMEMGMGDLMPWGGSLNFDLGGFEQSIQAVLDDPTLSGSPALSLGTSTDSNGNIVGTPEEELEKVGLGGMDEDELLAMLTNVLNDPSSADGFMGCEDMGAIGGFGNPIMIGDSQMVETTVSVEEVRSSSSWSESGRSTPSLVDSLPQPSLPAINVSTIDNAGSTSSISPVEQIVTPAAQQLRPSLSAPTVFVTSPTPTPVMAQQAPVLDSPQHAQSSTSSHYRQIAQPSQPPHHAQPEVQQHMQHSQHMQMQMQMQPQQVYAQHPQPTFYHQQSYPTDQVQHYYYAAPPPGQQVYFAAPYPPQPQQYQSQPQQSTWIAGALPFEQMSGYAPQQALMYAQHSGDMMAYGMDGQSMGQGLEQGMVWTH